MQRKDFFYITHIGWNPKRHIFDDGTTFRAAIFLSSDSTEQIWQNIIACWERTSTGLLNRIQTDRGSSFGYKLIHLAKIADVEVSSTIFEAHSSFRIYESRHDQLRTTFHKIMAATPIVERNLAIACSMKSINGAIGPAVVVPFALVFG